MMVGRGASALAAMLLMAAAAAVVACGGDDDEEDAPETVPAGGSPAATSQAALKAVDLFPDLAAVGLTRGAPERLADPVGRDIAFAVYAGATFSMRAEIRVYPTTAAAAEDFPKQVAGWKSPPVGSVFPFDLANAEGKAITSGVDEAKAWVATRADAAGKRVWTDIYRVGRIVVVAHTLASNETQASTLRTEMATKLAALPR